MDPACRLSPAQLAGCTGLLLRNAGLWSEHPAASLPQSATPPCWVESDLEVPLLKLPSAWPWLTHMQDVASTVYTYTVEYGYLHLS